MVLAQCQYQSHEDGYWREAGDFLPPSSEPTRGVPEWAKQVRLNSSGQRTVCPQAQLFISMWAGWAWAGLGPGEDVVEATKGRHPLTAQ